MHSADTDEMLNSTAVYSLFTVFQSNRGLQRINLCPYMILFVMTMSANICICETKILNLGQLTEGCVHYLVNFFIDLLNNVCFSV